jgi:hypothetical protein
MVRLFVGLEFSPFQFSGQYDIPTGSGSKKYSNDSWQLLVDLIYIASPENQKIKFMARVFGELFATRNLKSIN